MAQQNEGEQDESMMEEALKILKDEGFSLPNDVIDTLTTASRSDRPPRRRGSLRGHRMCEVQSNTRKQRNVRETSTKRGDRNSSSSDANDDNSGRSQRDDVINDNNTGMYNDVFVDPVKGPTNTNNGENSRPESARERYQKEYASESSSSCSASTVRENVESQASRQMGYSSSPLPHAIPGGIRPQLSRQDSESSIASSASSMNRKLSQLDDHRGSNSSSTADGGYNTSIENAKQVHEARAENLKNMNKHIENKMSGRNNNGLLRREISRDSGFTETTGDGMRLTPTSHAYGILAGDSNNSPGYNDTVPVVGDSSTEFKDTAMSNSDYNERSISTDLGDATVVTSSASDLAAAEMTSKSNEITADGTVVSSASKLADEEANSAMSRITTKLTDNEVAKMEDFESENRRAKSSRNDSISTSPGGMTTASSRHVSSMDQELNQENSRILASNDGRNISASMSAAQQLTRNQDMNNIEQSTDGSTRSEQKKVSDKATLSKSNVEETNVSEDGRVLDSICASQQLEAKSNSMQDEENITSPNGAVSSRKQDSTSSSFSEKSSSEKKTIKQNPYSNETRSTEESTQKQDSSKISKTSKSFKEITDNSSGRTEKSNREDSNAMSSNFEGKCESTETTDGSKLHKTMSTENSSENKVKSVTSNTSYSTSGQRNVHPSDYPRERRLSDVSNASTMSNVSGLSRENIKPPTYEETMTNLSRTNSNSSLFSRQDSSASSIASSAGAFNERQRQKASLAKTKTSSFGSNTNVKEYVDAAQDASGIKGVARQDSYSSDSTLSGERDNYTSSKRNTNNEYMYQNTGRESRRQYDDIIDSGNQLTGRVINHPIRHVRQSSYSRSFTDPVFERKPNRRATIIGDIVLSERELAEARQEVRSKMRGKDDTYVRRQSRAERDVETSLPRNNVGSFRSGFDSFGREIMDIVDSFFEDEDDFTFGSTSRRRRRSLDRNPDVRRRPVHNPYTVREDLSRLSSSRDGHLDSLCTSNPYVEYAASDSGFQPNRRDVDSYNKNYGRIISESASDYGGYDRHRPKTTDDSRALSTDSYTRNKFTDINSSARQNSNTASNEYAGTFSRFNDSATAGDNFQSTGKSILRDKNNSSSIVSGNRRSDCVRSCSSLNDYSSRYGMRDDNSETGYLNEYYITQPDSETDMSDAGSTTHTFRSLPPEVHKISSRGRDVPADSYRTASLPDIANKEGQSMSSGKHKIDDSRRQRIDKALSWIRSELGELRTQDNALMTQFMRCQESIEQLKKQRPWHEVFSDEEMEDGRHWEDWEIDDFDNSCQVDRRDNNSASRGNKSGTLITKEYQRMSISTTE